jgi:hypothetical protein
MQDIQTEMVGVLETLDKFDNRFTSIQPVFQTIKISTLPLQNYSNLLLQPRLPSGAHLQPFQPGLRISFPSPPRLLPTQRYPCA